MLNWSILTLRQFPICHTDHISVVIRVYCMSFRISSGSVFCLLYSYFFLLLSFTLCDIYIKSFAICTALYSELLEIHSKEKGRGCSKWDMTKMVFDIERF